MTTPAPVAVPLRTYTLWSNNGDIKVVFQLYGTFGKVDCYSGHLMQRTEPYFVAGGLEWHNDTFYSTKTIRGLWETLRQSPHWNNGKVV